jgi:L-lactate dehydrogenase (cytochrome)
VILKYAGKDGTVAFDAVHPVDIIDKMLSPAVVLGRVEGGAVVSDPILSIDAAESATYHDAKDVPHLDQILNLNDFEAVAKRVMRRDGWAYYSSAADDEITYRENRLAFHRIWLKPRVMGAPLMNLPY